MLTRDPSIKTLFSFCLYALQFSWYSVYEEHKSNLLQVYADKSGWWPGELPWLIYQNISEMKVISVTVEMTFSFEPSTPSALCENV